MRKILLVIIITLGISSCDRAEPETYLIPDGFTGKVQIIFNQNGVPVKYQNEYGRDTIYTPKIGTPVKYEYGRRIYEIPTSGILLTQFQDNEGFINRLYFYKYKNGKRRPLEVIEPQQSKLDSTKWVVTDSKKVGVLEEVNGSYGNFNVAFQEFVVSSYNTLDKFYTTQYNDEFMKKLDRLTGTDF